jgi:hypothetical protein
MCGFTPVTIVAGAPKLPSPLPSSTAIVLEPKSATTTSSLPSALKSAITGLIGPLPAAKLVAGWKVPLPLPSSTERVVPPALATTRSFLESPFRSAMLTDAAPAPTA